jgi:hypothetical protein
MLISCNQNAGQNDKIKAANRPFKNVAKLKYLGTLVKNQNLVHDEITSRLLATIQFGTFFVFSSAVYK